MKNTNRSMTLRASMSFLILLFLSAIFMGCGSDDENPAPVVITLEDMTFTVEENPASGLSIGTVEASATQGGADVDMSFSITSQSADDAVSIDATTGELKVLTPAVFDTDINTSITLTVEVSAVGKTESMQVTINIAAPNAVVIEVNNTAFSLDENPQNGASIGTISASATQGGESKDITFSISSFENEEPLSAIAIDAATGNITVADSSAFDYEKNIYLTALIAVTSGKQEKTARVTISIQNVADQWVKHDYEILGDASGDGFGSALSLDLEGNQLIVGAPWHDASGMNNAGQARLFKLEGSTWNTRHTIFGVDEGALTGYAVDVSIYGTSFIVGAPNGFSFEAGDPVYAGNVKLYQEANTSSGWKEDFFGAYNSGDNVGRSVAMSASNEKVVVGSAAQGKIIPLYKSLFSSDGDGLLFRVPGGEIDAPGNGGHAVATNGTGKIFAEGAINYSGSGRVRVFEIGEQADVPDNNHARWEYSQVGQDLMGNESGDQFGKSVSLSYSGEIIAIGSNNIDGIGYVKVFKRSGSNWVQVGQDIQGSTPGDRFGFSVAINFNGDRLIIGAPFDDTQGTEAGMVRVYELSETDQWIPMGPPVFGKEAGDRFGISVDNATVHMVVGSDQRGAGATGAGKVSTL
ncbi:cadherin domain-containing protein, partial [Fulvivirga kasyanovii]